MNPAMHVRRGLAQEAAAHVLDAKFFYSSLSVFGGHYLVQSRKMLFDDFKFLQVARVARDEWRESAQRL